MKKRNIPRVEARALVKSIYERGNRNASLISKETGVAIRTVFRYLSKLDATGNITDAKRSGRPKKNTPKLRRQLAQIKRLKPRAAAHVYAEEIRKRNKTKISTMTVKNALHQLGYHWRLPGRKKLSQVQKAARLTFAREHQGDNWGETWSFDEAYFNLYRHSNKCWISAATEETVQLPKLTTSQEKISVGMCFAINRSGKSELCFLPKNWSGSDLVKVFQETLLPSIAWPKLPSIYHRFIIDNDGRHQMDLFKQFSKEYRIHPLSPWPSNSPDLNPIENLFAWMKRYVENELPTNEKGLRQAIRKAFRDIPEGHIKNLMDSMENRIKALLKSKGERINY